MDTSRSQMDTSRTQTDTARSTSAPNTARTLPSNHLKAVAGKDSEHLHARHRGRRYLEPPSELSIAHNTITGKETPASRARSLTPRLERAVLERTGPDPTNLSGLSSTEYALTRSNRGRRHICHGGTFVIAHDHSGESHAERIWEPPPPPGDDEQAGGLSSARWAVSNLIMGRGKRNFFGQPNTHYHKSNNIADPGGPDCSITENGKFTSFLGPAKRHNPRIGKHEINYILEDVGIPEQELHTKKHFAQEYDEILHCDEEYPLGHSHGPDLYTKGFLGKSKHHFDGKLHFSKILANQDPNIDPTDLSAYGLGYRGRKKHFKRHNLEAEYVTHPLEMADLSEVKFQNTELHVKPPFHLQEPSDAESEELWHGNERPPEGFRRRRKSPSQRSEKDTRMFKVLKWNDQRKEEEQDEVEGENEFRAHVGAQKRCFGNAHNHSQIMLDYCDPPGHPVEELTPAGLKWGSGHGRKKMEPDDHLNDEEVKLEDDAFFIGGSLGGVSVGTRAAKRRHYDMDPVTRLPIVAQTPRSQLEKTEDQEKSCGIKSGRVQDRGRKYMVQRDTAHTVQPDSGMFSYFSDDEQTPRVVRTKSAPCFPMNPNPPSTKRIPIAERGRWKKTNPCR
mmetsp:Transcript_154315/g.287746  ORF Transcript_154315/g.287746 Transcript_154315/m.287746 type:complete len:618 (-) Transcript_154315:86-1939(-)